MVLISVINFYASDNYLFHINISFDLCILDDKDDKLDDSFGDSHWSHKTKLGSPIS